MPVHQCAIRLFLFFASHLAIDSCGMLSKKFGELGKKRGNRQISLRKPDIINSLIRKLDACY